MKLEEIAFRPATTTAEHFPAAATQAQAQVAAPSATKRHYVRGITISCDGEPTGALTVTITTDTGGTPQTLDKFYIPAAKFAPVVHNYTVPLLGKLGKTVEVTVSAPSAGVKVGAVLRVHTGE